MKKFLMLAFMMLFTVVMSACGNDEGPAAEGKDTSSEKVVEEEVAKDTQVESVIQEDEKKNDITDLAGVVNHFKEAGFEVGAQEEQAYEIIGATDGFSVELDGEAIELYLFDLEAASDVTKLNVENARKTDEIEMMGSPFPIVINGDFGMMSYQEHSKTDLIIETFKSM